MWSRRSRDPRLLNREVGAAAAGGGGVGIDDAERGADQIIDEIDLGSRQERHRGRVDQHYGAVAFDHKIVLGLGMFHVEFVLEAGTAATLDRNAQLGAFTLLTENLPDAAGGPLADGDGSSHDQSPIEASYPDHLV